MHSTHLALRSLPVLTLLATAGSAQVTEFGSSCATSGGVTPTVATPLVVYDGGTFDVEMTGPPGSPAFLLVGVSNTSWLGLTLPLDLGLFGLSSGCPLNVSPDLVVATAFDPGGNAVQPATGWMVGLQAHLQVLTPDPGTGAPIGGASRGLTIAPQGPPNITGLGSTVVNEDAMLPVFGNDLPLDPKQVCLLVKNGAETAAFLSPEMASDGQIVAEVGMITPGSTSGNVVLAAGDGDYLEPAFAPDDMTFGPEDVRVWTPNGTPPTSFDTPVTLLPPGSSLTHTCSTNLYGDVGPPFGGIVFTLPAGTACPPNTSYRIQIDASTTSGSLSFDYSAVMTNTVELELAACALQTCQVFQDAFLMKKGVGISCIPFPQLDGSVQIHVLPPTGTQWQPWSSGSFRICP